MQNTYDLLRQQPFLADLTDWQLERLARRGRRVMFPRGNRIMREGERADRLWLILTGGVDLDASSDGQTRVVDVLGPGAALGWSSMVPPHRWRFGAVARETTLCVEFDGPELREMCETDPMLGFQVERALADVVARRLQAARQAGALR